MSWPDTPRAGVCAHVSSLPGRYGIGELGAASLSFIDLLADMGIGVWQFLPLGPTAYADSPYQALSTFAGNPMLIDVADLVQLRLVTATEARQLTRLPRERVDFGGLIPKKERLLATAAARFATQAGADLRAAYDDFVAAHEDRWLHDYALFRVLKKHHAERPWNAWERRYRRRDAAALRQFSQTHSAEMDAVRVSQFLFDRQWRRLQRHAAAKDVLLFGDIPIYIALDSADAWAHPELLLLDGDGRPQLLAGVPPDYYSADGQLWGNPIYDWPYHERTDFRWWVERCRHTMQWMDLVRIDHFRGFAGYWAIPADAATARQGAWQPGPGHALFRALRAALGELPIVAEDLGVITEDVLELRDTHRIPGMVVLQFDAAEDGFDTAAIPEHCVCYTGTHDNDTTVGWFLGSRGDTRTATQIRKHQRAVLRNTDGKPATIHWDMIRLAFASPARIAMVPLQDYLGLGSEARMNTPGTQAGNWQWRVQDEQLTAALAARVAAMSAAAGRAGSEKRVDERA